MPHSSGYSYPPSVQKNPAGKMNLHHSDCHQSDHQRGHQAGRDARGKQQASEEFDYAGHQRE